MLRIRFGFSQSQPVCILDESGSRGRIVPIFLMRDSRGTAETPLERLRSNAPTLARGCGIARDLAVV